MAKPRIELTDSILDIVMKMSEGIPGAVTVLAQMIKDGAAIDPDSFMGGLSSVLLLDTWNIYGSDIWVLYKDVCQQNLTRTLGIIRAAQLGFLPSETLKEWAAGSSVPGQLLVDGYIADVCERLPAFGR